MSGFALHPAAFSDLEEIYEYIVIDSPDAAERVIADIFNGIRGLAQFPYHGHQRPDLTSRPLRFKIVREYLVAYVPDEHPMMNTLYGSLP